MHLLKPLYQREKRTAQREIATEIKKLLQSHTITPSEIKLHGWGFAMRDEIKPPFKVN